MKTQDRFVIDAEGACGRILPNSPDDTLISVQLADGSTGTIRRELLQPHGESDYRLHTTFRALFSSSTQSGVESVSIPVMEEELEVGKRVTESKVRVAKSIEEYEALVDEPATREEITIERVPMNRPVESPEAIRVEGDTTVIPVHTQEVIVEKRWVVREEIRVTKQTLKQRERQRVKLRREEARVERDERP